MNCDASSSPATVRALQSARDAQGTLLIIGIVGAVGSGTSWTARVLKRLLDRRDVRAEVVKARDGIANAVGTAWDEAIAMAETDPIAAAGRLQQLGDNLRKKHDNAIVAAAMIAEIVNHLATDQAPEVLICDSLRHPAEINLLRMVYGDNYWTLGTVCDLPTRQNRLIKKLTPQGGQAPREVDVRRFIERDQDDPKHEHGQHVAEAFELADYFVDTSAHLSDPEAPDTELDAWPVSADLGRFVDLLRADRVMLRPTDAERAMYHAYAARLGSACMSRQVGAALIDRNGQLIATGCNEVPRAGGGLYGQGDGDVSERERGRCHSLNGYCSNTYARNEIVEDVLRLLAENGVSIEDEKHRDNVKRELRRSRVGQLVEFSRSVHAEMDAVVSAARKGVSTVGAKLFVTTFPCHNCARHIVASGIDEVQFIEPYLKSKALALHADSITQYANDWVPPSRARGRGDGGPHRVLFRPYVGAAPRLFRRAFVKDGEVKDKDTGDLLRDVKVKFSRLRPPPEGYEALHKQIAEAFKASISLPAAASGEQLEESR